MVHSVWALASCGASSQSHDDKMALVDSLFSTLPTGLQTVNRTLDGSMDSVETTAAT